MKWRLSYSIGTQSSFVILSRLIVYKYSQESVESVDWNMERFSPAVADSIAKRINMDQYGTLACSEMVDWMIDWLIDLDLSEYVYYDVRTRARIGGVKFFFGSKKVPDASVKLTLSIHPSTAEVLKPLVCIPCGWLFLSFFRSVTMYRF